MTLGGGYLLPETSHASRPIPKRSKGHFVGFVVTPDGHGRMIRTESHLEMQVLLVLLMRPDIVDVVEQVGPVRYRDRDGQLRDHFFDFLATRTDGLRLAIAVRPWKRAQRKGFAETLACIRRDLPPSVADEVFLITDRHLDPIDLHNAWLLHGVSHPDAEADLAASAAIKDMPGAIRLADLADITGMGGRGFRALLRLVRARRLLPVAHERLTPDSFVKNAEVH